jgi:hypothetical protein
MNLICFTALELHPTLLVTFFIDYTQQVLIKGYDLEDSFETILSAAAQSNMAHHTNIIYIHPKTETVALPAGLSSINHTGLEVTEYAFAHPKLQPCGQHPPVTCPKCQCLSSWGKPIHHDTMIILVCKGKKVGGNRCHHKMQFEKPDGVRALTWTIGGGKWLAINLKI